jgi:hypothetical protein
MVQIRSVKRISDKELKGLDLMGCMEHAFEKTTPETPVSFEWFGVTITVSIDNGII